MEIILDIIGLIFQLAVIAGVVWFFYKIFTSLIAGEVTRVQTKRGVISAPRSPEIPKAPQDEVAESVRFALRVGVTPEQIRDIVVSEVNQYKASTPTATPAPK